MHNKLFSLLCIGLLAFASTSCSEDEGSDAPKLAAPVLSVSNQTSNGFTVNWQAVENAASYSYVLNNEAEQTTNGTSVSFSDLEPGTYTVKVKAKSGSADWADSNYASISATVTEGSTPPVGDESFTLEVSDITSSTAKIACTPSDNSMTFYLDAMPKAQFDQLYTSDNAFTGAVIESLRTLGSQYGFTLEETLEQLVSKGATTWEATQLSSGTEYVAYAFGVNTNGTVTTNVSTKSFTTISASADPAVAKWLGSWNAAIAGELVWSIEGQSLVMDYNENQPSNETFTIAEENGQIVLYGWSRLGDEFSALCQVNQDGDLEVMAGVVVAQSDTDGSSATWCAISQVNGNLTLVSGQYPAYTFHLDGDSATCTRYSGQLQSGGTFEAISLEIYAITGQQFSVYANEADFPLHYLAGDITLTKAAATTSMKAQALFMAKQKSAAMRVLHSYSYVLSNVQAAK